MSGPAFQFYAQDFYMDTLTWTDQEVGAYIRLLMYEWINGPIPNDEKLISPSIFHSKFEKIWPKICHKFATDEEGNFYNIRLEKTREDQRLYSEKQREKSNKRWHKDSMPVDMHLDMPRDMPRDMPKRCPSSSSSSSSSSSKDLKESFKDSCAKLHKEHFNNFWLAYPKKRSKGSAEKAWNKIKPTDELYNVIMDKLEALKRSFDWTKSNGKFIPYPATWLNAQGWNDEIQSRVNPRANDSTISSTNWLHNKAKEDEENGKLSTGKGNLLALHGHVE